MLTWLRRNMKGIMIVVAVLFAASMFYGIGYQGVKGGFSGGGKPSGLAKINGAEVDPLRYREILNRVAQGFGGNIGAHDIAFVENIALGQALDFTLMASEAKKRVRVSGREVDAAIDGIMKQQKVPSKRALEEALKRGGLSMGKFRDLLRDDILVQKFSTRLQEEVKVTPDDLREVRASHILLTKEAEAQMLLQQIKNGGDFAALAKKHSKDAGSAAKGGDLGYFSGGMMVAPFEQAAFALKKGEVSGIVKTPFGFHIIKLADSRIRKFPGNEKEPERAALREQQDKSFRRWYSEARGKAKVEIISPEMRGHDLRFRGQMQPAVEEYKKAVAQNQVNPYLHIFLGDSYIALGQKSLALSEYENAVKIEGGNPDLYLVLGKAYEDSGEKTLAAEQYRKASLIAGDNKALHEKLLKTFQTMQRNKEAAVEKQELSRIAKKEKFESSLKK